MSWTAVPESEMQAVLAAARDHRCVSCYGTVDDGHGFYCHACDDGCGDDCTEAR